MNYESRIKELEAELEWVRKRQQIQREELDRNETWHEYTGSRMYAVEAALKHLAETVDRFIASLGGKRGNGHEGGT